jgi:N6-adenosine-specific RNA methylase IME4
MRSPVHPFVNLSQGHFRCIVADPPWQYGAWGKASIPRSKNHIPAIQPMPYQTMTVQEIAALPIAGCAAEDCDLYLWTTQKYLPDAFSVMQAWGFRYCQALTWCKSPMGTGQGGLFCPTTEFILLGRKGRMPQGKHRIDSTWWHIKRTNVHSRKPEFFQDMIETVSDEPRLELFARRPREGWMVWGNEVEDNKVKEYEILFYECCICYETKEISKGIVIHPVQRLNLCPECYKKIRKNEYTLKM